VKSQVEKSRSMKTLIVLAIDITLKALGDVNLSLGMKHVGKISTLNPGALVEIGFHVFTNYWIWLGIALLIGYSLLELAGLSWLDLSYMLPMTSLTYVLTAFFAEWILDERVSTLRWAGICIISLGVLIVGVGDAAKDGSPVKVGKQSSRKARK